VVVGIRLPLRILVRIAGTIVERGGIDDIGAQTARRHPPQGSLSQGERLTPGRDQVADDGGTVERGYH